MKTVISTAEAPTAVGPYSQAIAAGPLVFCSGQIPLEPSMGTLIEGDISTQTGRVLENLAAVLRVEAEQVALARAHLEAGATVIDIGGESGVTNRPPVTPEEEVARVVPLIERVAGELGAVVSVDTYRASVARAARG